MTIIELAEAIARVTGYNREDLSILPDTTLEKWCRDVAGW